MQKPAVGILWSILMVLSATAQDQSVIHGRVINEKGEPLIGAVVTCIALPDSSIIAHAVTGPNGAYHFADKHNGEHHTLLEVSFLGYEKAYHSAAGKQIEITLREAPITLNQVTVTASASSLKHKPGKFIYTPRGSEVGGIDSYDLLRYTPLVTVENNAVTILGKGASTIYVNGRKPIMDNASLMEMLRATPASQIEKVEIITSHNSSYKASTTGGVVNIVLKKNPNQGLVGSASVGAQYRGDRFSPNASLYLGYSHSKFNASANFSYANARSLNNTDALYSYKTTKTDIENSTRATTESTGLNGNLSATYDFSSRSTLGASFHIGGGDSKSNSKTTSRYYVNGIIDKFSTSESETQMPYVRPEIGAVAYYNFKTDDKGSNLDLSANYATSKNSSLGKMEYMNGVDIGQLIPYSLFDQNSFVKSSGQEVKAKYQHVFADASNLESGYEFNASQINNDFQRKDFDGNQYIDNPLQSNYFLYDERVNALYITYDREWSDVVSTTVGLRAEHTHVEGDQRSSGETFTRNYIDFFPQLSLNFDFSEGAHCLSVDFARSIVRPFYNDLNPFKIWTSENTYTMGNIALKPMIYTDVELGYTLKGDYIFGVNYSYGVDAFGEYTTNAADNTTVSSTANFGYEHNLSFYFNLNKALFKGVWRLTFSATADYENSNGTIGEEDISFRSWRGAVNLRNTVRISAARGIIGRVNYSYSTPSRGITKIGRQKHLLGVSLTKQFKFGGALSAEVNNLLDYRPAYHYNTVDYAYDYMPRTNNISVQLKYSQTFGHRRVQGARDRSSTKHLERFNKK